MIKITRSKLSPRRYRFDASHNGTHLGTMLAVKRGGSYMLTVGGRWFGYARTLKGAAELLTEHLESNLPALLQFAKELAS